MPIKIKLGIIVVAVIAVFSVYKLGQFLHTLAVSGPELDVGAQIYRPTDDPDNDGLSNPEETFWNTDPLNPDTDGDGYLDGEEVRSRHHPLKPGPDDLIITGYQDINITDKVSTLMAGGYYAGDLKEDADPEVYKKALTDISLEAFLDGERVLNPDNIVVQKTKYTSNSKQDQEKYINAISLIIQNELWGRLINEPRVAGRELAKFFSEDQENIEESREYFRSRYGYYRNLIEEVNNLGVPPDWQEIHEEILLNLRTLAINHWSLAQTKEDPLKSILAMDKLMSVYQDVQPLLASVEKKMKENNLNPPKGELWKLIKTLSDE